MGKKVVLPVVDPVRRAEMTAHELFSDALAVAYTCLEGEALNVPHSDSFTHVHAVALSQAISLRRIADALDQINLNTVPVGK